MTSKSPFEINWPLRNLSDHHCYGLNMTRLSTELRNIKQRFAVLKVSNINNHDGSNLVCIGKSNTWVNLVVGFLACFFYWRHFFYNDKSHNSKRYPFANVKSFWHLMWKTFCHSGEVNSIKTILQTCILWTGQYVSYKCVNQFWLNLPNKNGKMFTFANGYLLLFWLLP